MTPPADDAPHPDRHPEPISLSVVIPCRDVAPVLGRQLAALASQRYGGSWEVVVADNGSTDATRAVAESYADRLPRLVVVDASARRGQAYARNAGVAAATGAGLLFVDADDEVAPGYLTAMGTALAQHGFVSAAFDSDTLNDGWVRATRVGYQVDDVQDGLGFLPFAGGGGLGIRRTVFDSVGGFDADYWRSGQDVDFCWRVQLAGTPLHFVPGAVVRIQWRGDLRGLYRQGRHYGRGEAFLYRRYRALGMARADARDVRRRWRRLAREVPRLRGRAQWGRWLRTTGRNVGRLQGSIRHRSVYL